MVKQTVVPSSFPETRYPCSPIKDSVNKPVPGQVQELTICPIMDYAHYTWFARPGPGRKGFVRKGCPDGTSKESRPSGPDFDLSSEGICDACYFGVFWNNGVME
jgi:hypothetical protein